MLQKITELWPGLLRSGGVDKDEEEEPLLPNNGDGSDSSSNQGVDEEQLLQDFKHLYWTRLMAVHLPQQDMKRKWPLGPDIIEECKEVDSLPSIETEQWLPLFDPGDFNTEHCPLTIEDYRLTPEDMLSWAE